MVYHLPLQGVRIHLSGSIPDGASTSDRASIASFVLTLAAAAFREGGTVIHGSHPSFQRPLEEAARQFVASGGSKDSLVLVRHQRFATTVDQIAEIEDQREYAVVQIIPDTLSEGSATRRSLVSMREWMAERCDVIIAVGGDHYEIGKSLAGVVSELEEALRRGKPAFVVAGFGGAVTGYIADHNSTYSRLRNGLPVRENQALANATEVLPLVEQIVSQIKLLPLIRETIARGRLFRVLALDGGGLRGAFTAAVIAKWDEMLRSAGKNELIKHFDLVAGTSTGAILAIGLALGFEPIEMLDFYRREGSKIFPKDRSLRHWLKSKHESQSLRFTLESILGDRRLSESVCRLVIPTVRAIHGEAEAIVTAHSRDRTAYSDISAVDAALASSAAPTYFDEAAVPGVIATESYLDGGLWANNPVLPAVAEAVRFLKIPLDRIDVLSVGTTGSEVNFKDVLGQGKLGWASSTADLFFATQEHAASMLADSLLSSARHLRINQRTPTAIALDDVEAIDELTLRGSHVGQDSFTAVRSRFLDGFHAPNWRADVQL